MTAISTFTCAGTSIISVMKPIGFAPRANSARAVPYTLNPASYEPARNLLFHQRRRREFQRNRGGLGVCNPTGRSLGALWHDFDDDGWLDLYVANDIAGSVFYHNTGGKFDDLSHAAWVADYRSAMGLAAGDYNRDGDDDLFVSHWVAQENALFDNLWADMHANPGRVGPESPGTLAGHQLHAAEGRRAPVHGRQ